MSKRMMRIILQIFSTTILILGLTQIVLADSISTQHACDNGAVYAMTNDNDPAVGNQIIVFDRDENGMLTKNTMVATQGLGSGGQLDPLGSQGSLVLNHSKKWLIAVNAGSNELSVFKIGKDGIELTDKVNSGGEFPVSVTIQHHLVYVLNRSKPPSQILPNISGFELTHEGKLLALPNSKRDLNSLGLAQISFDLFGKKLILTDKINHKILIFSLNDQGLPEQASPISSPSSGNVPFGFTLDKLGRLLVTEAQVSAVSSYEIKFDNTVKPISPSVRNGQKATCWIGQSEEGLIVTSNTASDNLSSYVIDFNGQVKIKNLIAGTGNKPIDLSMTHHYLYVLDVGIGSIHIFKINHDGNLTNLGTVPAGLSIFAQGLAAK